MRDADSRRQLFESAGPKRIRVEAHNHYDSVALHLRKVLAGSSVNLKQEVAT
jgi:hypothetical protein